MTVQNEKLSLLFYKDGSRVMYASHVQDSDWHRGCSNVIKSKKPYKCVMGCELPVGSGYTSLSMVAGYGRLDSYVDFALCNEHLQETEALLEQELSDAESESVLECWLSIIDR
ncbi:hypothetical protein CKO50_19230 [Pseudoalteromonas sp. HM-SA03]|uniref:hypothetical protein n=1 Tax=Pseudoalteromonas sp. HM-SA03 TaxID=2029678 RepID=UPI000BAE3A25|nr:hypothetical protein [Pseudoalteromonas sp. HM-SA03]PAX99845.1 hypothetical protein CKO50_19230 [Pseudoalteromonas sp. HM-SA03]